MNSQDFVNNDSILGNTPSGNNFGLMIVVVLVLLAVAAASWYFFMRPKPQDCVLGDYGPFQDCTPEDNCPDDVNQYAVRAIASEAKNGGKACPSLEERKDYRNYVEVVDCELSEWSEWRPCEPNECPPGKNRIKTRTVLSPANEHGRCDEPKAAYEYVEPTAIDCIVSNEWSEWRRCEPESNCLPGRNEYRTRDVIQESDGGLRCPATKEFRFVSPKNCEVDGKSGWMPCNHDCPAGKTHFREYNIVSSENMHGTCPERNQKDYATAPEWTQNKLCGQSTGSFCFQPYGYACDRGKNILNGFTDSYGECKRGYAELTGLPANSAQSISTGSVPKFCSYKHEPTRSIGYSTMYSTVPFDTYVAICKT